jgi:hypothetical protein
LERDKSLRELADGDVAATQATVNGFTVVDEVEATLGGAPALLLRGRFRARDVAYYQRKAHVAFEGSWITIAITAPYAERAACDETFDRITQSLHWRTA